VAPALAGLAGFGVAVVAVVLPPLLVVLLLLLLPQPTATKAARPRARKLPLRVVTGPPVVDTGRLRSGEAIGSGSRGPTTSY